MARAISQCPNCGERVSQFAAGCSICGYDLDAARARLAARRASPWGRVLGFRDRLPRLSDNVLRFAIALIVALAAPLFGLLFAGFLAWRAHNDGRSGVRNQMLAIAVLAAVLMVVPVGIWGRAISGL